MVLAAPYLTRLKSIADFIPAEAKKKDGTEFKLKRAPSEEELKNLLFAWYVNISVRSNGVVF